MPLLKNAKHEAVAQAFLAQPEKIGWKAYRSVYRKSSRHAAETAWTRLLKNAEFKARVDELMQAAADDSVMTAREVLQELSALGRGNLQDSVHLTVSDSIVADVRALSRAEAAAIGELTVESYIEPGEADESIEPQAHGGGLRRRAGREIKRVKLKLVDKRAALNDLGRHHKLFGGELQLDGPLIVEIVRFGKDQAARK